MSPAIDGTSMKILGLNFTSHNAAAVLISNHGILAAAEEERFDRRKHSSNFPVGAINYCLQESGAQVDDLDAVAFFVNPRIFYRLYNISEGFPKSVRLLPYVLKQIRDSSNMRRAFSDFAAGHNKPPAFFIDHHLAHAASCFFVSPFTNAAILTLDGRGEYETLCIFHGRGNRIEKRLSVAFPHSIGILYETITRYLGFSPRDEFKVMGLASYGTKRLVKEFQKVAWIDQKGQLKLNLKYFDHYFRYGRQARGFTSALEEEFGQARQPDDPVTEHHADIAYAVQQLTEDLVMPFVQRARAITGEADLCMAGGVALNCVANRKVIESGVFQNIFVQPAANDAGTSLGAALSVYFNLHPGAPRFRMENVYLGPAFTDKQIQACLEKYHGITVEKTADPARTAAELIHAGAIVGWFQGRMEFGPRALGCRSILAAPVHAETKDIINAKIKFREEFRPFAPAVIAGHEQDYFQTSPAGENLYAYMLASVQALPEAIPMIPAVVHVDGTSRIQVVLRETNPLYWQVIQEYARLSNIYVILNTSFNVKGEPIVCTPEDAIHTYLNSGLDYVVMGSYLISKIACK